MHEGERAADVAIAQRGVIALIATNLLSLAIDAWDATRFVLGERNPYYVW